MSSPLVSVIMPAYNEERNIGNAIASVLAQEYRHFEFIIVDDGSTDRTGQIIQSFDDERIRYIRNETNIGVTKSRNKALEEAKGKYIACLDADDTCTPDRLRKQVEYMESHPKCVLCSTYSDCDHGGYTTVQGEDFYRGDIKKALTRNNPVNQSSTIFPARIGGWKVRYPDVNPFEDYALWIELSRMGDFYILPEIMNHRTDYDNLKNKRTWAGYDKNGIYRLLLKFQWKATKATGYWMSGLAGMIPTIGKIAVSSVLPGFHRSGGEQGSKEGRMP